MRRSPPSPIRSAGPKPGAQDPEVCASERSDRHPSGFKWACGSVRTVGLKWALAGLSYICRSSLLVHPVARPFFFLVEWSQIRSKRIECDATTCVLTDFWTPGLQVEEAVEKALNEFGVSSEFQSLFRTTAGRSKRHPRTSRGGKLPLLMKRSNGISTCTSSHEQVDSATSIIHSWIEF